MLSVSETGSELALLTWSAGGAVLSTDAQAAEGYAALDRALATGGWTAVQERVFGELTAAPSLSRARAEALSRSAARWPAPATFVEGSPAVGKGLCGIHVIAARGQAKAVADGQGVYGTLVESEGLRVLGLGDAGRRAAGRPAAGPAEEAGATIAAADALLVREGFAFTDVARTWFYLQDILEWYGPFNAVRNAAYCRMGLLGARGTGRIPASTGVEGHNTRRSWCTLDLLALQPRPGRPVEMKRLYGRKQNEATEYGSAFARAMEVVLGDARYVFVSGTASIDEHGATVHAGDFEAQAYFAVEAVRALLEPLGARLADVQQATVFLKRPSDVSAFERVCARGGLDPQAIVVMIADVCRDELLFEIDATAVLPLNGGSRA